MTPSRRQSATTLTLGASTSPPAAYARFGALGAGTVVTNLGRVTVNGTGVSDG